MHSTRHPTRPIDRISSHSHTTFTPTTVVSGGVVNPPVHRTSLLSNFQTNGGTKRRDVLFPVYRPEVRPNFTKMTNER